jgi:hypothetical protein
LIDPVRDRSRPCNDHHPGLVANGGDEGNQRVVDDQRAVPEAEATHHRAHDAAVVGPVDAGDADAGRDRKDGAIANRLFDEAVQDFFDFEFAVGVKVGAAAACFRDDGALGVGEITDCLGTSGIDAEDVHASSLCYIFVFP